MRKTLKNKNLLAFALIATLAAFGCTTNRTHGAGEPYIGGPSAGPMMPTSNTGGTSVPTTPPPMTSSYRGNEQAVVTRPHKLTPDEAALVMVDHLPKVRVLGPVNPGPGRPYASNPVVTGQPLNYANLNPQVTVNSTLNSPATPVVTSGADINGDVASAAVFPQTLAATTPTTAATAVSPTTAAASVPSATTATPATTATTATTPTPTVASTLNTNAVSTNSNVRILTTNGRVTVTNAGTSNRQQ
ncbi:MAG TPA: hypothetical protein VKB93_11925 [Thermoanaerobaculia bacterium]|nr:hypothetical protein [Thermoanaerobaculia bacterium]